jgi:hypothetical protein
MNKLTLTILGITAMLAATVGISGFTKNNNDATLVAWKKVESAYTQRLLLLEPYLSKVKVVGKNAEEVTALSASYKIAKTFPPCNSSNAVEMMKFKETQEVLTAAIAKLVVSSEVYPKLLKDQEFRSIHSKLDDIESRISESTAEYNRTLHEQGLRKQSFVYRVADILSPKTDSNLESPRENIDVALVLNQGVKRAAVVKTVTPGMTIAAN